MLIFFRKWLFSDVMFRNFGSKISKCLKAARMFSFEVRRNRKTPNGVNWTLYKMAISDFFFIFWPRKLNISIFQKIIAYKIRNFQVTQNIGIHVIEIHTTNTRTKLQRNIFVFGCAMAKKPGKGDGVTFLKCIFWHFWLSYRKINDIFWNSETNLHRIGIFVLENFEFWNLTSFDLGWPKVDLSSGQI